MRRSLAVLFAGLAMPALAAPFTLLPVSHPAVAAVERYEVSAPALAYRGADAAAFAGSLPLAVGSALSFKGYEKGSAALEFWAVTDRGPNADSPEVLNGGSRYASKLFPVPAFVPTVVQLRVSLAEAATVGRMLPLREAGRTISGLPLPQGAVGASGEIGLDEKLQPLPYDKLGFDPEGIAADKQGNLWLVDEYGPFLARVDAASGEIRQRYAPGSGLPAILAARQPNRGFEGVTVTPSGKVVAIVQSTLDVDGRTRHGARFSRIVELDPVSGAVRQFGYPVPAHYNKAGDMKLGDIVALSDSRFAVIEQGKDQDKRMHNDITLIDLATATALDGKTLADGRALEYGDDAMLAAAGIQLARRTLALDLRALGWTAEKAEGLTLVENNQLALINDNDFGVRSEVQGSVAKLAQLQVAAGQLQNLAGQRQDGARVAIAPNREATELWLITLQKPLHALP
ncbi:esterase-like activity of phytase family protein [Vogesella sp. AC12]|uniref:esterase-like activity of phytase family protein n=1 Tax=Vogesella sp. AC12 TaxID=2950550 RepID=UPI00210C9C62|nr:esterase-like activity of phytase family protein [Vogesella sp. AC12]MCQ4144871.1 esterase-like activity of phytase family protein [Vogesella sp. AC12]